MRGDISDVKISVWITLENKIHCLQKADFVKLIKIRDIDFQIYV